MDVKRAPSEPIKAFSAFHRFLALGPARSVRLTAAELKLRPGTVRAWACRYKWRQRAEQYDLSALDVENQLRRRELESRAVDWARRHEEIREAEWLASRKLTQLAHEILDNPRLRCTFADLLAAITLASELGRRAAGVNSQNAEEQARFDWYEQIEIALDRAYRPAHAFAGSPQTETH